MSRNVVRRLPYSRNYSASFSLFTKLFSFFFIADNSSSHSCILRISVTHVASSLSSYFFSSSSFFSFRTESLPSLSWQTTVRWLSRQAIPIWIFLKERSADRTRRLVHAIESRRLKFLLLFHFIFSSFCFAKNFFLH